MHTPGSWCDRDPAAGMENCSMKDKSPALYRKVYQTLRGRILSGEYQPGAKIETEYELTQQLGASVITIRQAEQMLVEEELLDKQQGRGTFVPEDVVRHRKVLCVCGLHLAQGLRQRMGGYIADLIVLSQQETATRGMEFETVWLSPHEPERIRPYLEEPGIQGYWGFLFLACGLNHPLVERVRELKLRHVVISPRATTGNGVWVDHPEGISLALREFGRGKALAPTIVGIGSLRQQVEDVVKENGLDCPQIYLPEINGPHSFETLGYLRMDELLRRGTKLSRVLFLDDIVAQGATRAMLKHGYADQKLHMVVIAGKQEIIPLGLPVTYVVHDTLDEVRRAYAILEQQKGREGMLIPSWRSGFRVLQGDEIEADGTVASP